MDPVSIKLAEKVPVGTKVRISSPTAAWWVKAATWKVDAIHEDGTVTLAFADRRQAGAIEKALREGRTSLGPYGA